jgi:hypothetical protein
MKRPALQANLEHFHRLYPELWKDVQPVLDRRMAMYN